MHIVFYGVIVVMCGELLNPYHLEAPLHGVPRRGRGTACTCPSTGDALKPLCQQTKHILDMNVFQNSL